jgi:hypothetical protein
LKYLSNLTTISKFFGSATQVRLSCALSYLQIRISEVRLLEKKKSSALRCRECFCAEDAARPLKVCHKCGEGFHPECHKPSLNAADLAAEKWYCRFCIFSLCSSKGGAVVPANIRPQWQRVITTIAYDKAALKWDPLYRVISDELYSS